MLRSELLGALGEWWAMSGLVYEPSTIWMLLRHNLEEALCAEDHLRS